MPWSKPMDQKKEFVRDYLASIYTMTELCKRYGISRKTGYKWLKRYNESGEGGLHELSRRPHGCRHQTDEEALEKILEVRDKHPRWGPRKIISYLWDNDQEIRDRLPSPPTAARILLNWGRIKKKIRRRSRPPSTPPTTTPERPNHVWGADYKGEFKTGDGIYCYPLTVTDLYSKYIIGCEGLLSTKTVQAIPVFDYLFNTYGLPDVIRTDNGVPFASNGLAGLSRLSVWWLKLGITLERIQPGEPQQNGSHERMHRELKADCTRPPADELAGQQLKLDAFRKEFNEVRPHEALGQKTPASRYKPSRRWYWGETPEWEYPGYYEMRLVSKSGCIRLKTDTLFLSQALGQEYVGLHEIDDGIWSVEFCAVELGRYDLRTSTFHTGGQMGTRASNTTGYDV